MTNNINLNNIEFDEMCRYVCSQLVPSGSESADKETLTFAIYWLLCSIFERKIRLIDSEENKLISYRGDLQNLLDEFVMESFDALPIVDKNIQARIGAGDLGDMSSAFLTGNFQECFAV